MYLNYLFNAKNLKYSPRGFQLVGRQIIHLLQKKTQVALVSHYKLCLINKLALLLFRQVCHMTTWPATLANLRRVPVAAVCTDSRFVARRCGHRLTRGWLLHEVRPSARQRCRNLVDIFNLLGPFFPGSHAPDLGVGDFQTLC